jgi:predicted RNase H-like HicB family nuclease
MMHRYGIIIYWSDEDHLYIAEVPELSGCVTHGDTQKTALANATEAIQLWIDAAREFGNPVPEPRGSNLFLSSLWQKHSQAKGNLQTSALLLNRRKNRNRVYYDTRTAQIITRNPMPAKRPS